MYHHSLWDWDQSTVYIQLLQESRVSHLSLEPC